MNTLSPKQFLENDILLFDGAMGTYLAQLFRDSQTKCELANLKNPDRILAIHQAYISAGATAIKTNTFGANPELLEADLAFTEEVITAGWRLAAQAAQNAARPPFIFADIGPIPPHDGADLASEYREIIDIFLRLGAENFLFETFSSAEILPELAAYIKEKCANAFVITSFAVQPDGFSREGTPGSEMFAAAAACPQIDAVGFNCVSGPYHLREYIKGFKQTAKTLSVMPNAGYPTVINNRTFFGSNPEYFAEQMGQIAALGAKILGGCCGTTPEHIAAVSAMLQNRTHHITGGVEENTAELTNQPLLNRFKQKVDGGKRVLAVELDPPMNDNISQFMAKATVLQQLGVDIITVADCPIARARMDSSLIACKLRRELNIDVLPHMTCRDRNLNAIKALLLGLSVENVNNVLIVTGDPIPTAERDEIKSVFNFNSRMLAKYINSLNETALTTPFHICGALNINAVNFDVQLRLAKEKIANGMQMLLTQPVLSEKAALNLRRAHHELDAKILGGIMPVISHRNACFMNNEIAGINVCQEIIDLYEGKTKEEGLALAVKTSVEIAKQIAADCDGFYLMTPFNRVDIISDIVNELRELGVL